MRPPPLVLILLLFFGPKALAQAPAARVDAACSRESNFERHRREFPSTDKKCLDAAKLADDCCRQPNQQKCGYRDSNFGNQRLAAEGDQGAYAAGLRQARDLTVSANRNRVFASICRSQRAKADQACQEVESATKARDRTTNGSGLGDRPNTHTRDFRARMIRETADYQTCHSNQASQNEQDLQRTLATANASGGDSQWRQNCIDSDPGTGEKITQCYVANDGANTGGIVSGQERRDLPVTTAQLEDGCSAIVGPAGRGFSASHCPTPTNVQTTTEIDPATGNSRQTQWRLRSEIYHDEPAANAGQHHDDLRSYDLSNSPAGKPFYALSEDPRLTSGCQVRDNAVLACSPAALNGIQGTTAVVQGYPETHFDGSPRSRAEAANSVVVASGPSFYDQNSGTLATNAYTAPGTSGGATYFPPGTTIGGRTYDRPVLINPVSGGYGTRVDPITNQPADGGALVFTRRTVANPISSYNTVRSIYVQSISDASLRAGAPIFTSGSK